jgi:hypothetical protein
MSPAPFSLTKEHAMLRNLLARERTRVLTMAEEGRDTLDHLSVQAAFEPLFNLIAMIVTLVGAVKLWNGNYTWLSFRLLIAWPAFWLGAWYGLPYLLWPIVALLYASDRVGAAWAAIKRFKNLFRREPTAQQPAEPT